MARYTGPSTKIARKFGEPIFGADKDFEKRNYPPGQHGLASKRKKKSEYGTQLKEKQKVKYTYGLLEKQFRNLYEKASRMKGQKGENLIILLESRLEVLICSEDRLAELTCDFGTWSSISCHSNFSLIKCYKIKPYDDPLDGSHCVALE